MTDEVNQTIAYTANTMQPTIVRSPAGEMHPQGWQKTFKAFGFGVLVAIIGYLIQAFTNFDFGQYGWLAPFILMALKAFEQWAYPQSYIVNQ